MIAEDGVGRALGDPLAGIHHEDVVAQGANGLHDVLDHEDGDALAADLVDQRDADLQLGGIETGEPFVEQEQPGAGGERARELDALLVDVGELRPDEVLAAGQPDAGQERIGVAGGLRRGRSARCRRSGPA